MSTEDFPLLQVLKCIEDFAKQNAEIKAFTEKWDTKLSTQQNGLQLYTFLEQKFNEGYKNANDKEFVKRIAIEEYSQHLNSDNPFISKGYAWFKRGKDFSLKDFLLFKLETNDEYRTGSSEYNVFDDSVLKNETLIIPAWRKQEKRFNDAARGWAYARYVDYVKRNSGKEIPSITNPEYNKSLHDYLQPELYEKIIAWLSENTSSDSLIEFVKLENGIPYWQYKAVYLRALHEKIKHLLPTLNNEQLKRLYEKTFSIELKESRAFRTDPKAPKFEAYLHEFDKMPLT
ncbi:hypothetical protein [Parafilimonas terrae]|uniref:Uncharacterized protein n=1 Tax=Parafilimonas terrae TaxID=1465490 RepID=A0A1I5UAB6_9BACT|nr:hypothetical protein [Parafilimonas terrae]SFP92239.1 hypothetical protein SAMN05444277_103169 [Parafilimonas terrae]